MMVDRGQGEKHGPMEPGILRLDLTLGILLQMASPPWFLSTGFPACGGSLRISPQACHGSDIQGIFCNQSPWSIQPKSGTQREGTLNCAAIVCPSPSLAQNQSEIGCRSCGSETWVMTSSNVCFTPVNSGFLYCSVLSSTKDRLESTHI